METKDYFSTENISLVISILALLLSALQYVIQWVQQRQKLEIEILASVITPKAITLHLSIINRSRLPVAVTRISLVDGDRQYDCHPEKRWVVRREERSGGEVIRREQIDSTPLPIGIASLGAVGAYILFEEPGHTIADNATALTLQICTNRGKTFRVSLSRPQTSILLL